MAEVLQRRRVDHQGGDGRERGSSSSAGRDGGIMQEMEEVSRVLLERAVQMWQPRKFFSFYLSSMKYLAMIACNIGRVAIPQGAAAVVWIVLTAFRVVILFFALIILVVGPRIGLPRAIYQVTAPTIAPLPQPDAPSYTFLLLPAPKPTSPPDAALLSPHAPLRSRPRPDPPLTPSQSTWKVLVRCGCVSPQNIMRAGADAAAAAAGSDDPDLSSLTGPTSLPSVPSPLPPSIHPPIPPLLSLLPNPLHLTTVVPLQAPLCVLDTKTQTSSWSVRW